MGILGTFMGDAKNETSSSSQTTTQNPTITAGDDAQEIAVQTASGNENTLAGRDGIAQNLRGGGIGNTYSFSDYGAIRGALQLAETSVTELGKTNALVTGYTEKSNQSAFALAENARKTESSENFQVFAKYAVVVLVSAIAGYAYVRKG